MGVFRRRAFVEWLSGCCKIHQWYKINVLIVLIKYLKSAGCFLMDFVV